MYNRNFTFHLKILVVLFMAISLAGVISVRNSAVAQGYYVGSVLQVPIGFNANENVVAIDFSVNVSGGTLVSVNCGGSGFSTISSGGNSCVLANLSGGSAGGIVGTATVRANAPGSLQVSVSGDLSNASGSSAGGGNLYGGSYTVQEGSPPVSEVPPEEEPDQPTDKVLLLTVSGDEVPSRADEIVLDENVTEIKFLPGQWPDSSTIILIPVDTGYVLNFEGYAQDSGDQNLVSRYLIEQQIVLEKLLEDGSKVLVTIPRDVLVHSFGYGVRSEDSNLWDARLLTPVVLEEFFHLTFGKIDFAVEIGSGNSIIVFDKPVEIVLPGQAGKKAGYRQLGLVGLIEEACINDDSGINLPENVTECYTSVGDDMVILTTHLTTFFSYSDFETSANSTAVQFVEDYGVFVLGILLLLGFLVIVAVVVRRKRAASHPFPTNEQNN